MDLEAVWQQVARFQESYVVTSGSIAPSSHEQLLVREFLQQVPVAELFACLQDASDRYDDKQVQRERGRKCEDLLLETAASFHCNACLWLRDVYSRHALHVQVKQICSCIDRVLGADGNDGVFFHPEVSDEIEVVSVCITSNRMQDYVC